MKKFDTFEYIFTLVCVMGLFTVLTYDYLGFFTSIGLSLSITAIVGLAIKDYYKNE